MVSYGLLTSRKHGLSTAWEVVLTRTPDKNFRSMRSDLTLILRELSRETQDNIGRICNQKSPSGQITSQPCHVSSEPDDSGRTVASLDRKRFGAGHFRE